MLQTTGKRLIWLAPILLFTSFFSFSLMYLSPGDPARLILEAELQAPPTGEQLAQYEKKHGLDKSFLSQYGLWLARALHGDLGRSLKTGREVFPVLLEKLGNTAKLFVIGMGVSIVIALPLGVLAAVKADSPMDHFLRFTSLGGISVPNFWWGILLVYLFSVKLQWLPAFGSLESKHFILPAATIGITGAMDLMRLTRTSVLEVLNRNYVRTARAKGLDETAVLLKHVLRNALIPIITSIGLYFGHMVGGSILIETLFAWPGIGRHLATAASMRDLPVIQGIVFVSGIFFVLLNLLVDLTYSLLDPQIRIKEPGV
ncbi:MAG: ABC transporter permease [Desulfobulbaceae bacterium]|nr:ABC transporter permease [Desulfobulbaceae bacterium]